MSSVHSSGSSASFPAPVKIRFAPQDAFAQALREKEALFFQEGSRTRKDQPQMYLKTALHLVWFAASYGLLVFAPLPWWGALVSAVSLGFAMAGIGFNIMHDGGHRSYSERPWLNRLTFDALDFLGGSSYFWHWKHNHLHHAYTNIHEHDADLEVGIFGRLSPHQKLRWFHRFQHFYMWFLYGVLAIKWQFVDDYVNLWRGKIGEVPIPRPKGWDLFRLFFGKAVFLVWAFAIPLFFHPWPVVVGFYVLAAFVEGLVLAVIFQMAHCLEEAEFPATDANQGSFENDWFAHQLQTTVNFAPKSRILRWYCGGLNHQIEHHLFPKVSHVHYPALAVLVEETCKQYKMPYKNHPTLLSGLRSHYRWLVRMGQPLEART